MNNTDGLAKHPSLLSQINLTSTTLNQWGLVEYKSASEAEVSEAAITPLRVRRNSVRVRYCTPGKRAVNLYQEMARSMVGAV